MSDESESMVGTKLYFWSHGQAGCKPVCRLKWIKNKGAVLIVIWSFLVTPVYYLVRGNPGVNASEGQDDPLNVSVNGIILLSMTLLFPIGGLLSDVRLGRYKTVRYSMWIMWAGAMFATFGQVLPYVSAFYDLHIKTWAFRAFCIIMVIGLAGFQSNIVQFGIDQLIDASADEIRSFILWYVLSLYISGLSLNFISECFASQYKMIYIKALTVALCLTLALSSDFVCKQWLVEQHLTKKPFSEVLKVIRYSIRKRKVRYEFITGDDDEIPSLFDVAKHQYGGPFTSLQVDNVRTFLKVIAVLATCGILFGAIMPIEYARE